MIFFIPKGLHVFFFNYFVEFLIVAGICFFMASGAVSEPFCEGCKEWYEDKTSFQVPLNTLDSFTGTFQRGGTLDGLPPYDKSQAASSDTAAVITGCSKCQHHEPHLKVVQITFNEKNEKQEKVLMETLISPSTFGKLQGWVQGQPG